MALIVRNVERHACMSLHGMQRVGMSLYGNVRMILVSIVNFLINIWDEKTDDTPPLPLQHLPCTDLTLHSILSIKYSV